mmetsp:Transcript_6952/g.6475  ORF Transcript_6952/g.6475 Transcript_6952/m.6475 type:complete len:590 (+) Transcript_6952:2890-4659(+)
MKSIKRERNKTKYSFNNLELNDKRKILEDEEFTTADLPFQICRAYFRGTNMIGNQWTIPLEPPQKLKNLVYMSAYEEFTTQLNNCSTWKKKERYCYYFIGLIFPPLLPLFMYRSRRKKFKKLRNVAAGLQKGIWLNNTEKRRVNYVAKTIKISASPDYTMACIDFLDIERDREYYNGPTLPLTFHLSGDGFFNSPFNLSYKDCLVRSLSLLDRTENFIEIYIENLNSLLKSLSFFEYLSFSEAKFWKLIKFLHTNNLGILKKRSIKAELAILEYKNKGNKTIKQGSDKKNYKSNSQTYIFHFDFISKYPQTVGHIVEYCRYELYTRNTDIKLAIVFSRSDQSTIIPMTGHIDIQAYASRGATESLLTSNERFNNSTKISDVTIPKFYNSGEESNRESDDGESSEEYDQMFTGLKSKWTEPFLIKGDDKKTKQQRNDSYTVTESNYSQASYSPNKVEVEDYENNEQLAKMLHDDNPLNDFRNRRHSRGCCFQFKISIVAFLKLGFLRSSLPPKYPILNLSMMIIVLFLDIAAAMMIFLLYWQKEEFQAPLAPFAFIYPFTVILSPLMALTSILVCKSSFYRIFMNLNALT